MDRLFVVTGATDGIGKETALELARRGGKVVVHGRTKAKAEKARAELAKSLGEDAFETCAGDFARLEEVRALGDDLAARFPRIDVLVDNAGAYFGAREVTADGFEATLQVNHLAPFLLTHLVLPSLRAAQEARVVVVSSMTHQGARVDLAELEPFAKARRYDGYSAYASSKLMNVLFAYELARRLRDTNVAVNALHPGVVGTKLLRAGFGSFGGSGVAKGARTSVFVATDASLAGVTGKYFQDERMASSSPASHDRALAKALYEKSAQATSIPGLPE